MPDGCTDTPHHHSEDATGQLPLNDSGAGVERGCGGCVWLGEAGWFWLDGFTGSFQRVSNISEWFRHCLLAVTLQLLYMSKYSCQVGVGFQCWSTPKDQYIQSLTVKLQGNRSYLKEPKIGHLSIFYQHMECQFLCSVCLVLFIFFCHCFNPSLCRCATFNMFFIRGIMTQQLHCLHSLIRVGWQNVGQPRAPQKKNHLSMSLQQFSEYGLWLLFFYNNSEIIFWLCDLWYCFSEIVLPCFMSLSTNLRSGVFLFPMIFPVPPVTSTPVLSIQDPNQGSFLGYVPGYHNSF